MTAPYAGTRGAAVSALIDTVHAPAATAIMRTCFVAVIEAPLNVLVCSSYLHQRKYVFARDNVPCDRADKGELGAGDEVSGSLLLNIEYYFYMLVSIVVIIAILGRMIKEIIAEFLKPVKIFSKCFHQFIPGDFLFLEYIIAYGS